MGLSGGDLFDLETVVNGLVPKAATDKPPAVRLDGFPGTSSEFARADHTHEAKVQRTVGITNASGILTWEFARPIVCAKGAVPPLWHTVEDPGSPVVVQVTGRAFTTSVDGLTDIHTSVTVKAQRSRALPATILALTALVNFDIFGIVAPGVKINLGAAEPTQ